ncbi:UNVERIFIED_CONTAM: hypothetical protein Slati_3959000 [Sesamum latifolium]|uniref:Uncharacterized protein n=1 Tax=Sesamum latifolium TaxID=2727402 RepID=A0AAW2TS90_9LAMI
MSNVGVNPNSTSLTHEESDEPRRSKRVRVVKDFGNDFVIYNIEDNPIPFKDAMASSEVKQWKEAVKREMDSIVSNGTWQTNRRWQPHRHTSPTGEDWSTPPPVVTGSTPAALPQASLSPRIMGPTADPHRRSTSSDTSTEETVARITWSHPTDRDGCPTRACVCSSPPRLAPPPEAEVLEEEGEEEAPVPVLPAGRRRDIPRPEPPEVLPQWLARLEHLQKGLQDVKYQIEGAPEDERQGVPFTDTVMADELPLNCRTPTIAEYDGTKNPMETLVTFRECGPVTSLH